MSADGVAQLPAEINGQFIDFRSLVYEYAVADVVHNDAAGIAVLQVMSELFADFRIDIAVHIFVQHEQHFFAIHG